MTSEEINNLKRTFSNGLDWSVYGLWEIAYQLVPKSDFPLMGIYRIRGGV